MNKGAMLDTIKEYLNIKKNTELAKFLGISSQAVSNWYSRNTFDAELLYTKCVFINPDWLLTGSGQMLKSESSSSLITHSGVFNGNNTISSMVNSKIEGNGISNSDSKKKDEKKSQTEKENAKLKEENRLFKMQIELQNKSLEDKERIIDEKERLIQALLNKK